MNAWIGPVAYLCGEQVRRQFEEERARHRICECGHTFFRHSRLLPTAECREVWQRVDGTWHDCDCKDFREKVR